MTKMFMLIGLPGSGKSTYAKTLAKQENAIIFSSDSLRKELLQNENDQSQNGKIFQELHNRIIKALSNNQNVIFDATNISSKKRRYFLSLLQKIDCIKIAYLFATPYEKCLERNKLRARQVPEYAIQRMYEQFNVPCYQEGFDKIEIIYPNDLYFKDWQPLVNSMKKIAHDNPYHTLSIGDHMEAAYQYYLINYYFDNINHNKVSDSFTVLFAVLLHDIGKPVVKKFKDNIAHYYNHQNVGAYEVLFVNVPDLIKLQVSLMIQYHMHPFVWAKSPDTFRNDSDFLGEAFVNDIYILHECDKYADKYNEVNK